MIYLLKSALKYAVNICEELPNYRVSIALSKTSLFLKKMGIILCVLYKIR